jgi:hypothetical protein
MTLPTSMTTRKGGRPSSAGSCGRSFGLAAGAQHGVVELAGGGAGADFLGFADEAAALVAVDEAVAGAAVAVVKDNAALEDVGVVAGVFAAGWGGATSRRRRVGDEKLVIGTLGAATLRQRARKVASIRPTILRSTWEAAAP